MLHRNDPASPINLILILFQFPVKSFNLFFQKFILIFHPHYLIFYSKNLIYFFILL